MPNSGENDSGVPAGLYLQGFELQAQNADDQPNLKLVKQEYNGHFAYIANQSGVFSVKT